MLSNASAAVFLDRDGTINEERHYLSSPDDLVLLPGAAEGMRRLQNADFQLVVVTNQSPIGRGYFDEARLQEIHERLDRMLIAEGIHISGWYYCPHVPDDECDCRKPRPGMLLSAAQELNLDLSKSWMIGDKSSDIEAGRLAGAESILVSTGYGSEHHERVRERFHLEHFVDSLNDAATLICRHENIRANSGAFLA